MAAKKASLHIHGVRYTFNIVSVCTVPDRSIQNWSKLKLNLVCISLYFLSSFLWFLSIVQICWTCKKKQFMFEMKLHILCGTNYWTIFPGLPTPRNGIFRMFSVGFFMHVVLTLQFSSCQRTHLAQSWFLSRMAFPSLLKSRVFCLTVYDS